MKNKIIIFFVLIAVFVPLSSWAGGEPPNASLNINVFSKSLPDAGLNFSLTYCLDSACPDPEYYTVAIKNFKGSLPVGVYGGKGLTYILKLESEISLNVECISDNPNEVFAYQPNAVIFYYPIEGENIICNFGDAEVSNDKNPVLIVPGLLGTEMKNGEEFLWINTKMVNPLNDDSFMDPLRFLNNLKPSDNNAVSADIIKSIITKVGDINFELYNYAGDLIDEFEGQGYIEGETLFTFPYDWRYGVTGVYADGRTNSDLLKDKINQILQQTGSSKVDVVAHSLGGLIVKKYVMDNTKSHNIGKAIFVGVPNTGSPKAVKVLLQGDNFGVLGLNDSEMKKIAENMPASYDLLPSQEYYNQKGSFIQVIDEGKDWPGDFNVNIDDLDYSETESFLTNDHDLNSLGFNSAEALHTKNFDNFDLRQAGVDLYSIVGCKKATLGKITERRYANVFGSQISYQNPKYFPGDGTVPLESATNLPIDQSKKFYFLPAEHSKMLSANGSRQEIVNLISGSALSVGDLMTQDINQCKLNGRAISVYSPVDIFVTDQNGNKLGFSEDGSIVNEIPGADFEAWGEHKFVFLPQDGGENYSVGLEGTASGTFTIESQEILGGQTGITEVFKNIPVTTQLTGQINLSEESTTLSIKETPQSATEVIFPEIKGDNLLKSKDQCKKNGWKKFDGKFKNQGQCEKFVKSQKAKK